MRPKDDSIPFFFTLNLKKGARTIHPALNTRVSGAMLPANRKRYLNWIKKITQAQKLIFSSETEHLTKMVIAIRKSITNAYSELQKKTKPVA